MRFTEEKERELNEAIKRVTDDKWTLEGSIDASVFCNGWAVCAVDDLTITIETLKAIRKIIIDSTGVRI